MSEGLVSVKELGIIIRPLQEAEEMSIGVDLQRRVWGYAEIDTAPDQIFILARESGGQVLGGQELLDGKTPKAGPDRARIRIPAGIRQITSNNPAEAERIQRGVRSQFERHIAERRAAVGFEFDAEQGSYVLEPYED
jgi:predicted GNAT superfamily acetyltransferase